MRELSVVCGALGVGDVFALKQVGHGQPDAAPRGFTSLCQRVAHAISGQADKRLRKTARRSPAEAGVVG